MAHDKNGDDQHLPHQSDHDEGQGHHILPEGMAYKIWGALMVLTVVTVVVARQDFGAANFVIAMAVATLKAGLVALFFMGLKYDKKFNSVIFITSIIFMGVFFVLTGSDIFFRNHIVVRPLAMQSNTHFKKPWIATAEIRSHGQELFSQQCVTCHGAEGQGNGPAAGALNPPPRNFTQGTGWKNGRKPSQVFGTLLKGLNSMPSFASLPEDDRWSLAHYVLSLGPTPDGDSDGDLKAMGIDPTKETSGAVAAKSIPIELAIELVAQESK